MRNSESSFKWILGTLIAFLAAGSGIVALLNYVNSPHQPPPTPTPSVDPTNPPRDTCMQGYVWREAGPGDHVCVIPRTRTQTAYDNNQSDQRHVPGSDICIQGYVWREAFANDHVCVTPETRAQAQYDNSQAPYRVVP